MAIIESENGTQEGHSRQLDDMVARIKELEKENEGLKARLDGVLASILNAHSSAFPAAFPY